MSTSSTRSSAEGDVAPMDGAETSSPFVMSQLVPKLGALLKIVALPFFLSRVWVAIFTYWGHTQRPFLQPIVGGWAGVNNWWLNPWTTYDSEWYMQIAQKGYTPLTTIFYPLYPMLLKLAGHDSLAMAAWGIFLSNLAFWVALALLFYLTRRDFDRRVAIGAVWVLAFFPSSAVFSAVYTESTFLLLIVSTFICARRRWWIAAGVFGFFVGLTRNLSPLLFVALLFEYWNWYRSLPPQKRDFSRTALHLACLCLPVLSFVAYQRYVSVVTHSQSTLVHGYQVIGRRWMFPLTPLSHEISDVFRGRGSFVSLLNLWATLTGFYLIVRYWKKPDVSHSLFLLGINLAHLTLGNTNPPYTLGAIRYVATAFPFAQRLSLGTSKICERPLTRLVLFSILLMTNALMSWAFGHKFYMY